MQRTDSLVDPLLVRAITGVIRNAEDGELPLFACTLGLRQAALQQVLSLCAPERLASQPMSEEHYRVIMLSRPQQHAALVELLLAGRSTQAHPQHAEWLAYGIAAAATGSRHLWEDLGMRGREEVSALLQRYFEPLFRRNIANLKWKRFLFAELAATAGHDGRHGPDCSRCARQQNCFPAGDGGRQALR